MSTSVFAAEPKISIALLSVPAFTPIVRAKFEPEASILRCISLTVVAESIPDVNFICDAFIPEALIVVSPSFPTILKILDPTSIVPKAFTCFTVKERLSADEIFSKFITVVALKSTATFPVIFKVSPVAVFAPPSRVLPLHTLLASIVTVSSPSPVVMVSKPLLPPLRSRVSSPEPVVRFSILLTFAKSANVLLTASVVPTTNSSIPPAPSIVSSEVKLLFE